MKTSSQELRQFILDRKRIFARQGSLITDGRRYRGRLVGPFSTFFEG
jgi:hypothetical protein